MYLLNYPDCMVTILDPTITHKPIKHVKSRMSYNYYCIKFYNTLSNRIKNGPFKASLAKIKGIIFCKKLIFTHTKNICKAPLKVYSISNSYVNKYCFLTSVNTLYN